MLKNHIISLSLLACFPLLAGCSTVIDGSTQQVNFKTIGADDATCDIQSGLNDYRYSVRPPQSVLVQRSRQPLIIVCNAPGNRVQNLTVESSVAGTTFLNTLTGGVTAPWDAATGAMYKYPEDITIDFTGVLAKNKTLPAYENAGALASSDQGIEYFGPDSPAVPNDKIVQDRYKAAYDADAQLQAEAAAAELEKQRRIEAVEGGFYGDKGNIPTPSLKKVSSDNGVVIAPISEASPSVTPTTKAKIDEGAVAPQSNSKLGKPIFPSSTTF